MTDTTMTAGIDVTSDLAPLQAASALNPPFVACAAHLGSVVQVVKTSERLVSASDLHEIVPWAVGAQYIRDGSISIVLKPLQRPRGPFTYLKPINDVTASLELVEAPSEDVAHALAELNGALDAVTIPGASLPYPLDSAWGWEGFDETREVCGETTFRCSASACRVGDKPGLHLALVATAFKSAVREEKPAERDVSAPSEDDIRLDAPSYSLADYVAWCSPEKATQMQSGFMKYVAEFEAAGCWGFIRRVNFETNGRLHVAMALRSGNPDAWLEKLQGLRDRLIAAMEYESVHGVDSLIKPDHPRTLWLEERQREDERLGLIRPPPPPSDAWEPMLDWRTFDFIDAARSGLRPGTPPPSETCRP